MSLFGLNRPAIGRLHSREAANELKIHNGLRLASGNMNVNHVKIREIRMT